MSELQIIIPDLDLHCEPKMPSGTKRGDTQNPTDGQKNNWTPH